MKQGKWICYPGDYEIMLAEKVQARRFQRDFPIAPFWRVDSPWHNVRFFKEFTLEKPTTLRFFAEGRISVFFRRPVLELDDVYSYEFTGELEVPAGEHYMEIWVYNPNGLPCLKIDGDGLQSDETFEVGNNQIDTYSAYVCDCGDLTPNTYRLPIRKIDYLKKFEIDGDVVYDFGKLIFAFAEISGVGDFRLYFGETLKEALNDASSVSLLANKAYFRLNEEQTKETFCEQVEFFTLEKEGTHTSEVSKAFRFLRVKGGKHALQAWEEYDDKGYIVRYVGENERLNKIFDVSAYTFSMCAREFYLDGAKRDRWLWGGDAYEAEKAEYYYQWDTERIKRSIIALFGKAPVNRYINHIMDYTLYTIISVWEYYEKTGDLEFLRFIQPMFTEHLNYARGRVSDDGFIHSVKYKGKFVDWVFVDWGKLPDKNGEVCFEQILLYSALQAAVKVYETLGLETDDLKVQASRLREKTDEVFWDEKRGAYVFARNDGVMDETLTCHANVFAVLFRFADEEKAKRITAGILNGEIPLSITPFMIEFVLASLFEVGETERAANMLEEFWGGMVDAGATTFWETYKAGETEETATAMYGRPFGRSLCHVWGAGPLYLIPKYYFGIDFENFGETFVVQPNLDLTSNSSITVPLKRGSLTVKIEKNGIEVLSTSLNGVLKIQGKTYPIKNKEKRYVKIV